MLVTASERCFFDVPPNMRFYVSEHENGDWRSPSLETFWLPWATFPKIRVQPIDTKPNLADGDWEHGRELFFDVKLQCAKCHRVRGEGGAIGPDLSNLVSRDAASVLRDIMQPSASINPDYVAYNVALNNGSELTGFIRSQDNTSIKLIGADGKETQFRPTDVKEMHSSLVSLMPTGLLDAVKEESIRDLLTFLMHEPPKRSKAEVDQLLNSKQETHDRVEKQKSEIGNQKLRIVLVASKQDHGAGQHDYPAWQKKWHVLLGEAAGVIVTDAWEWPTEEQFQSANVLVFYFWNHDWSAARYRQLDEYLARGGGIVLLHAATIADKEPEQLAERIGLAAQPGPTKYRHTSFDLKFVAPTNHVITRGFPLQIRFLDEPYWPMFGDTNKIEVLATTEQEGKSWPMIWTFQRGKGRVFASILGHYSWTLDDPLFRMLIFRGIAWAASEPPGRFDDPAIVGAGRD
jgi:putative heme-binding domain-containing protein